MNSYIIAQSGTHGTGKTTAALEAAVDFKMANPDKRVGFLLDQEDSCPYLINQDATPESQMWIFTNRIRKELSLLRQFDVLVTDRTVVDVVAYTSALGFHSLAYTMRELMIHHLHIYRSITVRTLASNAFCHDDGVRAVDPDFRNRIEHILLQEYEQYKDYFTHVSTDPAVVNYV